MKRFLFLLLVGLLSNHMIAQEYVTVTANSEDIANNLDLNLVAALFGKSANVEEFESMLNNPDSAFSNLDLNGDGQVDYLRVVESSDGNRRLVIIQAVLARDIFQDVASIYLEKDKSTNEVSVQVIGDKFIYGDNYIITPVYIYRPVIYSWLWSSIYVPYCSPWYWGYYPFYWRHWHCLTYHDYWRRCHHWHHHHHYCSFRHHHNPHHGFRDMYHRSGVGRSDYAVRYPDRSYESRHGGGTYRRENEGGRSINSYDNRLESSSVRGGSKSSERSNSRTISSSGRSTVRQQVQSTSVSRSTDNQRIQSTSRTSSTTSRTSPSSGRSNISQRFQSTSESSARSSASGRTSSAGSYRKPSSNTHQSTSTSRSSGSRQSSSRRVVSR